MLFDKLTNTKAVLNEEKLSRLSKAIATLESGVAEGAIPNPSFEDAKYPISRFIEDAWEKLVSDPYFYSGRYASQPDYVQELSYTSPHGPHDLPPLAKRINRATEKHPDNQVIMAMKRVVDELLPLSELVSQARAVIVKRQPKSKEEREAEARYVPPIASAVAAELLTAALESITEANYERLVESLNSYYEREVKDYVDDYHEHKRSSSIISRCTDYHFRKPATLKPGWKEIIAEQATRDADDMRRMFVIKNLRKLASIIDAKGNLDTVQVVGSDISLRGLQGDIEIRFKDGSRFTVSNSVVFSTSIHGKLFVRFPLTFHNVVMPDGSKMLRPSEERVNNVFAGRSGEDSSVNDEAQLPAPGM